MSCNEGKSSCGSSCVIAAIVGLVFGALIGILFAFDLIPNIVVSVWIAFGLGVLALVMLFAAALTSSVVMCGTLGRCLRKNAVCLLVGIIGTIVFTVILLSIVINPILLSAQVLVAIAAFFFVFMLSALVAFILCLINENRYNEG